jgi:RimJ/RimL family protein N-acetyltransferase
VKPLETERLRLRDLQPGDLDAFLAYRQDPQIARYQSWVDYSRADAEAFFRTQRQRAFGEPGSWYQIGIAERAADALLGDCAVHFLSDRQLEVGFTLARAHHGQGYMTEAATALLGFLFGDLETHRVTAITDTRNEPCVSLLERLGFRREGHLRQNVWFKGAWGDEFLYALLADEWRALRLGA